MANEPRLRLNNGSFYIYQYVEDFKTGKKKQKTLKNVGKDRKSAEKQLKSFLREYTGVLIKFGEALHNYDAWYMSQVGSLIKKGTFNIYRANIAPFYEAFWNIQLEDIRFSDIEEVKDTLIQNGHSNRYINMRLSELSKFFKYALKKEWIRQPPVIQRLPEGGNKSVEYLSKSQIRTILDNSSIAQRLYILFMLYTGLRASEINTLKWKDIDLQKKIISIKSQNTLKSGRSVPIFQNAMQIINSMERLDEYVSPFKNKEAVKSSLQRLSKKTGIKIYASILRRTFATLMVETGIHPVDLGKIMGHSKLETTYKYYQGVDIERLRKYEMSSLY